MPPLVSVLMPYRDASPTLASAARSILSQDETDLELVAIDDGSKDDGTKLIASLRASDPRIRLVSTSGTGIVGALTAGLAVARGEFIARMDADDVSLSQRLSKQIALIGTDPRVGAVGVQVQAFPANAIREGLIRYVAWQNSLVTPSDHERDLFVESPLCHSSVLMRRDALESVGAWKETTWAEDYDLWLRMNAAGWRFAKVPEVLHRWRHHSGQTTFRDPRYDSRRFIEAKAHYLAAVTKRLGRPTTIWGAGPTGKRLARALEQNGVRPVRFVDVDPRKLGRVARGAPIVSSEELHRGEQTVIAAVGSRGARALIREHLIGRGFVECEDFVCAA
jgi:glycosyltransferase involved in cell wall biosynthesis